MALAFGPSDPASLFRGFTGALRAIELPEFEVHFEDIDQLDADQSIEGRPRRLCSRSDLIFAAPRPAPAA